MTLDIGSQERMVSLTVDEWVFIVSGLRDRADSLTASQEDPSIEKSTRDDYLELAVQNRDLADHIEGEIFK